MKNLLLLSCIIPFICPPASGGDCADLVPSDAVILASLPLKEKDPGQKWLFSEIMGYLLSRAGEEGQPPPLSEVNLFRFSKFCFALLPPRGSDEQMLLAADMLPSDGQFGITYGDQRLQLNVRDKGTASQTQTGLLSMLLSLACEIPAGSKADGGIFSNPEREKRGKFSAYSVTDEKALMATRGDIIKKALSGKGALTSTATYREIMALLPKDADAYGYARDDSGVLTGYLQKGKTWQALLLAILSPSKRAGLALDAIDRDQSMAVLVLSLPSQRDVKEVRARLEGSLPLLVSQYLARDIKSEIRYEELPLALKISARLSNTSSFWKKTLGKKTDKSRTPGVRKEKKTASAHESIRIGGER